MGDTSNSGGASGRGQDTDRIPKESILPVAIAGGAMLVCCLGSIVFVSGASGIAAWFGGIDAWLAAAIAVAIFAAIMVYRRIRKPVPTNRETAAPRAALKGDP